MQLYARTSAYPGYRARIAGNRVEWGHPLEDNWTRYVATRLEAIDMSEREDGAEEELDRLYPAATVELRFEQDTREPIGQRPREGYYQSFGIETGYAGAPLVRLEALRDEYRPLTDFWTWRMTSLAGLIPYHRDVLPIHERYFLGGNEDMRGFGYRGAGYFDDDDKDVPIGGAAKLLVKNELLFPIFDPVSGVLFTDFGLLGASPSSWEVPRLSSGAGLRFDLQRVQVGLDLAVPILTDGDDDTRFFHFSLQSQF